MKRVRAIFRGMYEGKPFTYIDPEDTEGSFYLCEWREFTWSVFNYGCDCNRAYLVGKEKMDCGDTIKLDEISPVDEEFAEWGIYLSEIDE